MKFIIIGFCLILFGCVNESRNPRDSKTITDTARISEQLKGLDTSNCTHNYDSSLVNYANLYQPDSLELNKSFSINLDSFLLNIDTNCLRKQKMYEFFVSVILAKHLLYELKCCNQDYDLLQMRVGSAGIIVKEFERIAYHNNPQEMLNTGSVVPFIEKSEKLKDNLFLKKILIQIKKQEQRIKSGAPWRK